MLLNYFKILFRGIVRNKLFSLINLLGLSVGLTCTLLIVLYVVDEFAYETHHVNLDRTYLMTISASWNGETQKWTGVPNKVGPTIAKEIPEVEHAVRFFSHEFGNLAFVSTDQVKSSEKSFGWADPEIFDVLSYTFIKGDAATALTRPNTAVMSESAAKKYFGTTDVIGKTFTVDKLAPLEVTGVFTDPPATSRFQYPIIGSFPSHYFGLEKNQSWGNASFETYLLLRPGSDPAVVEKKIADMLVREIPEEDNRWFSLHLKPLKDLYIYMGDVQDFYNPTYQSTSYPVRIRTHRDPYRRFQLHEPFDRAVATALQGNWCKQITGCNQPPAGQTILSRDQRLCIGGIGLEHPDDRHKPAVV